MLECSTNFLTSLTLFGGWKSAEREAGCVSGRAREKYERGRRGARLTCHHRHRELGIRPLSHALAVLVPRIPLPLVPPAHRLQRLGVVVVSSDVGLSSLKEHRRWERAVKGLPRRRGRRRSRESRRGAVDASLVRRGLLMDSGLDDDGSRCSRGSSTMSCTSGSGAGADGAEGHDEVGEVEGGLVALGVGRLGGGRASQRRGVGRGGREDEGRRSGASVVAVVLVPGGRSGLSVGGSSRRQGVGAGSEGVGP